MPDVCVRVKDIQFFYTLKVLIMSLNKNIAALFRYYSSLFLKQDWCV